MRYEDNASVFVIALDEIMVVIAEPEIRREIVSGRIVAEWFVKVVVWYDIERTLRQPGADDLFAFNLKVWSVEPSH